MGRSNIFLTAWLAAASSMSFGQCHFPTDAPGRVLTYTFDPTVTGDGTTLHVTLRFQGNGEAQEQVEAPSEWAGQSLHGVVNLRAVSAGTSVAENKIVRHPPDQEVILTYDIVKDWTGPFRHPAEFHGALMPEYIEINGANALVRPSLSSQTPVTVHFDWQKLPAAWVLATSFGASSDTAGRCQSYSGAWSAVRNALFAAGDLRIRRFQIGSQPAVLAIRGQWTFSDDQAVADIQRAVSAVRDFWHDDRFPYYLVTLKAFDNEAGNNDGSQFANAFWLYLSRQDSLSALLPTLVHETFHEWNPRRMGTLSGEDYDAIEWFREGFTNYYGYRLAYRAGLIQLPVYIEKFNRDLRDFGSSDGYVRGNLIALWLDQQIRKDSGGKSSLDNVMFDLVSEASQPLTKGRILETAGRYLSPASQSLFAQAVEPGGPIPSAADALGPCVHGTMDEIATFNLGFDLAASRAAGSVTGVAPEGPAFEAGLRDGQRLNGRLSVYNNQPDKIATITVQDGDAPRTIEYYPRGKPATVLQYHLEKSCF